MVLSNKKLKQKLRAELAESLVASVLDPNANGNTIVDPNQQNQSLKELLGSVAQKPRLSKREKRRKNLPFKGLAGSVAEEKKKRRKVEEESQQNTEVGIVSVVENGENGGEDEEREKKKKKERQKRKRGVMESEDVSGDGGGEGAVKEAKKSNTKKKRKKEKNKNKKKKQENIKEDKIGKEEQVIAETDEDMNCETDGVIPTKVYVGGIPYYYMEDDIQSYFKGCGTITEVECKMQSEDGRFTGIAFITFQTEDAAKRALALDRAAMGERFLTIQQFRKPQVKKSSDFSPEMVDGYNRIYVGNLSWDITEDDLRKFFSDCSITSIRLGLDKETGDFRGYGHVDFKDSFSMVMALKLNQEILCGRPIKISCAVPKKGENTHARSMPTKGTASTKSEPANSLASSGAESPSSRTENGGADNGNPMPAGGGSDNGNPMPTSGKIRRRTCYECGQKGHLSSACPNKQTADATNSGET